MERNEKIATVRELIRESTEETSDSEIGVYISMAEELVARTEYPCWETPPKMSHRYDFLSCRIAQYWLNKRGAEGEVSHSEDGVGRSYESGGVPKSMLREIIPQAKAVKVML